MILILGDSKSLLTRRKKYNLRRGSKGFQPFETAGNWKVQYKKNSLLCYWKSLKLSSNTVQVFKVHSWGRAVITPNNSAVSLEWLARLTIYSAPGASIYKTKRTPKRVEKTTKQYINDEFQQYLYQSSRKHPTGYLYPSVKEQLIINIRSLLLFMITATQVQRELRRSLRDTNIGEYTVIQLSWLSHSLLKQEAPVPHDTLMSSYCYHRNVFHQYANNIHDAGSRNCEFSVLTQSIKLSTRPLSYNNVGERK